MTALRAGDLVHVTRAASVQFAVPILLRVIRVLDRPTYDGWIWLDGYQLDPKGEAVARRAIFVQPAGLLVQRAGRLVQRPTRPVSRPVPSRSGPGAPAGPGTTVERRPAP